MNTIKENSKAAFNQQAATYDKDIKGQHARSLYPVLLEKLSHIPFQSALDLGCGTGEMLKLILQKDPHKELCGIDLSEEMLAVAKSKLPEQVKLLLGDSEALPFPDNAFDVVYCNDSFHHYPAPKDVLREINRVLKPGGTFLMGDCWQPFVGRGEMALVVEGASAAESWESLSVEEHVALYVGQGMPEMAAIKAVAADRGLPKSEVYARVKVKEEKADG